MTVDTMKNVHGAEHDHHDHDSGAITVFGFWVYILTDLMIFGCLFAVYATLDPSYGVAMYFPMMKNAAGQMVAFDAKQLFELNFVLIETFVLLFSSISYGFAMIAANKGNKSQVLSWLFVTFILGAVFIGMEVYEFHHLVHMGNGPSTSATMSAFFTLVGTHGLHVTCGLVWMLVMIAQVASKGLTSRVNTRLSCLSLFWHFLDIVWICVFTFVYLKAFAAY